MMDFVLIICGALGVIALIIGWGNSSRITYLEQEVMKLRRQAAQAPLSSAPHTSTSFAQPSPAILSDEDIDWDAPATDAFAAPPVSSPAPTAAATTHLNEALSSPPPITSAAIPRVATPKSSSGIEANLGAKLPVWIGAISLICAAFYLVKYSIDSGLLGPTARVMIGLVFGGGLAAIGKKIADRPKIANALRIGQGLVGAGLVSLTLSLYGAVHLYHIIAPLTGFISMSAVVVATILLSLRLGQPVAVFGMVGGFLAPALFSTGEANFMGLYGYLFILYAGLQTVMIRQNWHTLSIASLVGVFLWGVISTQAPGFEDQIPLFALFSITISGISLFQSRHAVNDQNATASSGGNLLNILSLGGSTVLLLAISHHLEFAAFEWAMSGLLSFAIVALTYLRPTLYRPALWGKMGSDALLLALVIPQASLTAGLSVTALYLAIYGVLPALILTRDTTHAKDWALTQIIAGLGLYVFGYFTLPTGHIPQSDVIWGLVALLAALYSASQVARWRHTGEDAVTAAYAVAATSFISLGLAIELPAAYLPTAFAFEIAALYVIYRSIPLDILQKLAKALLVVFIAMNYKSILYFGSLAFCAIFDETSSLFPEMGQTDQLYHAYLPTALGMALAHWLYRRQKVQENIVLHGLFGSACMLLLGALYISLRASFQGDLVAEFPVAGYTERSVITLMLGVMGIGFIYRGQTSGFAHTVIWGEGLILLALSRYAYFDLFLHNPRYDSSQIVGNVPILNAVTLTYSAALALTVYALRNKVGQFLAWDFLPLAYKALALAFLLALTTLNVRQFFHGGHLDIGSMTNSELYSYSVVWLITGLGLLGYGMKRADKAVRLAALAFVTLTIAKVFLVDASNLEGLFRIFSFLGLGVSLIGLSMFYTRFMKLNGNNDA